MPEEPVPSPASKLPTLDGAAHLSAASFGRYRFLQRLGEGGMGKCGWPSRPSPFAARSP